MLTIIQEVLRKHNAFSHYNQGILVAKVHDTNYGFSLAKDILYAVLDTKAMLYLSGGRTPKDLYHSLAAEEKLAVGAVGLIDERFGEKWHGNSNEKMLQESGLLRYLQIKDIKFYPILTSGTGDEDKSREQTAVEYDKTVRELNTLYQKNIGIRGIGLDGHTAGIAGNRHDFHDPMFGADRKNLLVSEFDDKKGIFKERISMTFLGLSMLDLTIVMVFGEDKKDALDKMFADGSEEEIPSRFFKRPEIAQKTLLITDQNV